MRQVNCSRCKASFPLRNTLASNGYTYCETCAQRLRTRRKATGQIATFTRSIDGSLCALCGAENLRARISSFESTCRFANNAGQKSKKWPYPQWLKFSLAGLVLLLLVSLATGRKYFHAEVKCTAESDWWRRQNMRTRSASKGSGADCPEVRQGRPASGQAALKIGDMQTAAIALQGHDEGHFENGQDQDVQEMKALWTVRPRQPRRPIMRGQARARGGKRRRGGEAVP